MEISPVQLTRLASLTINLYALPTGSKSDSLRTTAWRQLARGLQFVDSEAAEDWAENLVALNSAKHSFERLGLNEPALWAHYFKAYFEYFPLYRFSESLAAATDMIETSNRLGLPVLTMLGHQLAGQIRIERESGNNAKQARLNYQRAQENFKAARQLARDLNNSFETIWAINNSGITYSYQDQMDSSLNLYANALEQAVDLADTYLINLIGTNTSVAQEQLGHIREAIDILTVLQQELTVQNDPLELEHVLNLLAGYHFKLYQFPQALEVLNQSLEISQNRKSAESRGRERLLLSQIYSQMGWLDKSLVNLELSIPDLELSRNGRGLKIAWALSATINRLKMQFEEMRADRKRQQQFLTTDSDQADWLASKARDAEAEKDFVSAIGLYRRSDKVFATTINWRLGQLALLRACVLEIRHGMPGSCSIESLAPAHQAIQPLQGSAQALEGKYLWAQMQSLEGNAHAAGALMAELVEDIRFFRKSLPGVLGAWYWDARKDIFDFYMELHLNSTAKQDDIALQSMAALNHLRNTVFIETENHSALPILDDNEGSTDDIRVLLARREQAETTETLEAAQRRIDQFLLASTQKSQTSQPQQTVGNIHRQLTHLPDDWSFLTYYFSDRDAYAWTANTEGLQLHRLGSAKEIGQGIESAKANIRTVNSSSIRQDLADLGARLIAPVSTELRSNILFLGAGRLSDFPLEALIDHGDSLIKNHRILNVMSGRSLARAIERLDQAFVPRRMFLAGNPVILGEGLQELGGAAKELRVIQTQFPGAKADLFEGKDLILPAFNDKAFSTADLIHIASHATIDVSYPELSRIILSSDDVDSTEFFTPADLAGKQVSARLVVLSACSTVGINRFEYDSHLGFVSEFLQSGSSQVMASLWPVPDRGTVLFMAEFYRQLAITPDISAALRSTKLKRIEAGEPGDYQWTAFQLFSK